MFLYSSKFHSVIEDRYEIKKEAHHAALFTTGNGYFGIRGSFEEFGSVNIQGAFVRGLIDEIIEIPNLYVDNIYMRKYYFDELKAKTFEYQDSGINFADFLLVRFVVGGKIFFPWEGKIIEWTRYIDTKDGSLNRKVIWDDGEGHLSEFNFKRMASFSDNHVYLIKASMKKLNHDLPCSVQSGIDTYVKTNGQKSSKLIQEVTQKDYHQYLFDTGEKYGFDVSVSIHNKFIGCDQKSKTMEYADGMYTEKMNGEQEIIGVEKLIYVNGTMDEALNVDLMNKATIHMDSMMVQGFDQLYQKHVDAYQQVFQMINIDIEGQDEDDAYLKYANYQTLIGIDRYDHVHSLSAKNLTGQKYNQFVWWDAEIYQFPVYLMTSPEAAKNTLIYRYDRLEESKKNAVQDGLKGAKFAFCSSVKGDERVWAYARHPFLQIHINSDIAYAILNYYKTTNDLTFLKTHGIEMLVEIARYWISRVSYDEVKNEYQILNVTGTDEHHPYIHNNAYTNYLTQYTMEMTYKLLSDHPDIQSKLNMTETELRTIKDIANRIKLPALKDGLIPQFDGYFELSKTLEVDGNGIAKGFQMKESGLYHESQVIKQPDVMMLFTYLNLPNVNGDSKKNWAYYEPLCEASSSLTYPAHAIASIDQMEQSKFYEYWKKSIQIDIIDLHKEAHLGLHAACMAGGWYSIYRGLFGFEAELDYLVVNPKAFSNWKQVSIQFMYHGQLVQASLSNEILTIQSDSQFKIKYHHQILQHTKTTVIPMNVSGRN